MRSYNIKLYKKHRFDIWIPFLGSIYDIFPYKIEKNVTKITWATDTNRLDLTYKDGTIKSFGNIDKYDIRLGVDWVMATHKDMQSESGQQIPLNI